MPLPGVEVHALLEERPLDQVDERPSAEDAHELIEPEPEDDGEDGETGERAGQDPADLLGDPLLGGLHLPEDVLEQLA